MNSLQRVRATVAGEPVDHLAAQPIVMMFAANWCGVRYEDYTRDAHLLAEVQLRTAQEWGLDCLLTCSDPAREVIDLAGEESVDWFPDQGPVINEARAALRDKGCLSRLEVPATPPPGGRMEDRVRAIRLLRGEVGQTNSVVGWIEGPLALAAELRGLNTLMLDFVDDPAFVDELLAYCAAVALPFARAQIAAGADTIGMSDAAASMLGPVPYHRHVWPVQLHILQTLRAEFPDLLLRQHMCGRIDPLAAAMAELPVDIYDIDFPADLETVKSDMGEKVISGNVSTINPLLEGTPAMVRAAAGRCHEICGARHIVNSGCEVSPHTPPANLRALLDYAAGATW